MQKQINGNNWLFSEFDHIRISLSIYSKSNDSMLVDPLLDYKKLTVD